jgi:hypothetical protein
MKTIYNATIRVVSLVCLLAASVAYANQADIDAEKSAHASVFAGSSLPEMKEKARQLELQGYSDPKIFDLVEKQVLANMSVADKNNLDAVAWLVRALGFSGNEKYLPTLNKVATEGSEKLRRHANTAISELPQYSKWNAVISQGLVNAPAGKLGQQRVMNMLQAGDVVMVRMGLRQVYENYSQGVHADKMLLDEVKKMLVAAIEGEISIAQEDNVAWMCRVMGNTGDPAYKAVLNDVVQKSGSAKIRKYAQKSM